MLPNGKLSKSQERANLGSYVKMLKRSAHVLKLWSEREQLLREN